MGTSHDPDSVSDSKNDGWLLRTTQLPLRAIAALRKRADFVNSSIALGFAGGTVVADSMAIPTVGALFVPVGFALLLGAIAINLTRPRRRYRRR